MRDAQDGMEKGMEPHQADNQADHRTDRTRVAIDVIVEELRAAWRLHDTPPPLASLVAAAAHSDVALQQLVAADLQQFHRRGLKTTPDRYRELPPLADRSWLGEMLDEPSRGIEQRSREASPREVGNAVHVPRRRRSAAFPDGEQIGDFRIERLLGEGSHARVYLARQQSLDRVVALKVSQGGAGDEARAMARLDHPNIVAIYSESQVEGRHLLAMRYVAGRTLAQWIEARRRGAPAAFEAGAARRETAAWIRSACSLMKQVADALDHAHRQGVLHRDVKPSNVLLDRQGQALLTDFGVAVSKAAPLRQSSGRDAEDVLGGTTAYMAPEHLRAMEPWLQGDAEEVDARADLYSMGLVLYELLAGALPWPAGPANRAAVASQLAIQLAGPPPLPAAVHGVLPSLDAMLARLLHPSPSHRYQSAAEVAEDLRRQLQDLPPLHAADPSRRERLGRWARRHRWPIWTAASVMLAAGVAIGFSGLGEVSRLGHAESLVIEAEAALEAGQFGAAAARLGEAHGVYSRSGMLPEWTAGSRRREVGARLANGLDRLRDSQWRQLDLALDEARLAGLGPRGRGSDDRAPRDEGLTGPPEMPPDLDAQQSRRWAEATTELAVLRFLASPTDAPPTGRELSRVAPRHRDLALLKALHDPSWRHRQRMPHGGSSLEQYLCGLVELSRRRWVAAAEHFEASLDAEATQTPRFWAVFSLAYALQSGGRWEEAAVRYGQCVGMRPEFAWPHYNLGLLHIAQQQWAPAERELNAALELDPELAPAHADLGALAYRRREYRRAETCLDRAIELGLKTPQAYLNRAAAREALQDSRRAREDLRAALRIDPENREAMLRLRRLQ